MSLLIKELPESEKPRERLLRFGVNSLSNEELLAVLLRTGVKNHSVKDVAMSILKNLNNLNELDKISINRLADLKGVGQIKAMTIIAAVELGRRVYLQEETNKIKANSTTIIYELFKNKFKYVTQEKLIAIYFNTKLRIIEYKTIFIGTVDSSTVHPREIFKEALNLSASSIVIIHNHPSGDPTPSKNDIEFTKKIIETGQIMQIPLIDHIIFGNNIYSSYIEHKWWETK